MKNAIAIIAVIGALGLAACGADDVVNDVADKVSDTKTESVNDEVTR